MSLADWLANRWIEAHRTSRAEIADLLAIAARDIAQSGIDGLEPEWRLNIAYNAARQLADAALRAEGYRPGRDRPHERAIQSLRLTVGVDEEVVRTLDAIRRKRNIDTYERSGAVTPSEASAARGLAIRLEAEVTAWLRATHPSLL